MSTKVFSYGTGFWAGAATFSSVMSLVQDAMGREGYAQHVLNHWVSGWYSVPLATLALALTLPDLYAYVKMRRAVQTVVETVEKSGESGKDSNES